MPKITAQGSRRGLTRHQFSSCMNFGKFGSLESYFAKLANIAKSWTNQIERHSSRSASIEIRSVTSKFLIPHCNGIDLVYYHKAAGRLRMNKCDEPEDSFTISR
jgi:hypothetical protein